MSDQGEPRGPGRVSTFTEEIGEQICEWLANGRSLRSFCEIEGNPTFNTVYRWLDEREAFSEAYARARERQAHNDADRINQVAEKLESGLMAPDVGRVVADAMKWTASRRLPKTYGDKVSVGGHDDRPIVVTWADGSRI